jgi:CRISPR/Cas system CSM-associated protein Csm4 (group 5 of RAMP superfamily)
MATVTKLARQKKAAKKISEIMYASLQQFSKEEQERRIKEIHKIALKARSEPNRKPSKRSSTQANPRVSRPAATVR